MSFVAKPKVMWRHFETLFDDDSEVQVSAEGSPTTVGEFATRLLNETRYHGTSLPRIPNNISLIFQRELTRREILMKRDMKNEQLRDQLEVGTKVQAQYLADWALYPAVIDQVRWPLFFADKNFFFLGNLRRNLCNCKTFH